MAVLARFLGNSAGAARWRSQVWTAPSLEGHIQAFGDVGAEAGGDDDAAADFLRADVGGPDRVAAGAEERIGVRRLGLGGVEIVMAVGLEDARLLGAGAVGLDVDDFLVVAGQRQRALAAEIFRGLGVEEISVGLAGRGVQLAGGQAAAARNPLVVAELVVIGPGGRRERRQQQAGGPTNLND